MVVEAPRGAWPASCAGFYDVDEGFLEGYYTAAATREGFDLFLRVNIGAGEPALAGPGRRRS
jgi:hypothetical protein